jgi:hypothetical protein
MDATDLKCLKKLKEENSCFKARYAELALNI